MDINLKKLPKKLLLNIVLIIAFVFVFVTVTSIFLNGVTHHGKSVPTPDFVGLTVPEAEDLARDSKVRVEVIDTTYVKGIQRGGVFMQEPAAGSMVKKNRRIRLVINAMTPKKVMMPYVEDCPVRQAVSDLTSKGLEVGKLIYVSGYDDRVIQQMVGGKRIEPGTLVESGTKVSLKVGLDPNYRYTTVPNVQGERAMQARKDIWERSLNVRKLSYDSSVKTYADSLNAVVYRQTPDYGSGQVTKGSEVTLYLSADPDKLSK